MPLTKQRQQISTLDQKIVQLLEQRLQVGKAIGKYKAAHHMPILDPKMEQQVLAQIGAQVQTPNHVQPIQNIFKVIMQQTKTIE